LLHEANFHHLQNPKAHKGLLRVLQQQITIIKTLKTSNSCVSVKHELIANKEATYPDEGDEFLTRVIIRAVERQHRPKESSREKDTRKESTCCEKKGNK